LPWQAADLEAGERLDLGNGCQQLVANRGTNQLEPLQPSRRREQKCKEGTIVRCGVAGFAFRWLQHERTQRVKRLERLSHGSRRAAAQSKGVQIARESRLHQCFEHSL
jgi:hypothetical protein